MRSPLSLLFSKLKRASSLSLLHFLNPHGSALDPLKHFPVLLPFMWVLRVRAVEGSHLLRQPVWPVVPVLCICLCVSGICLALLPAETEKGKASTTSLALGVDPRSTGTGLGPSGWTGAGLGWSSWKRWLRSWHPCISGVVVRIWSRLCVCDGGLIIC